LILIVILTEPTVQSLEEKKVPQKFQHFLADDKTAVYKLSLAMMKNHLFTL